MVTPAHGRGGAQWGGDRSGGGAALKAVLCISSVLLCVGLLPVGSVEAVAPRRLLEVVDLGPPVISPDGTFVAFRTEQASVERNTYDSVWYVQRMDVEAPPVRVADGGVPLRDSAGISVPVSPVWSPDGQWIYYRALIDGRIDVWRAARDGSRAEAVTRDLADVRNFVLSDDGGTLKYSVGATREEVIAAELAEYDAGIRIDSSVPVGQNLFRSGALEGRLATQRFGEVWFDRISLLDDLPDRWRAIDLVTGRRRDIAPPSWVSAADRVDGLSSPERTAHDSENNRVAVLTREAGERVNPRLSVLPSNSSRKGIMCAQPECIGQAITDLQWRPSSDELLFTVTARESGMGQLIHAWDVQSGGVRLVTKSDGLMNGGRIVSSSCGVSASFLACVAADPDRPPRLERVDLDSGALRVMFEPNESLSSEIAEKVSAELLLWEDADGEQFSGQLFSAHGDEGPSPLFVTYYTCTGFLRGGVGDEWPLASLAAEGVSALCINAPPHHSDPFLRFNEGLTSVESVVRLLASDGRIDASRVGMGGLSFGTAVTLWVAIHSDVLAAASVTSPVVSPNYYLLSSMKGDVFSNGLRQVWGLGAPNETPEQWRKLSPLFSLDRIDAPLLLQMPEQEYLHSLDYVIPLLREQRADLYVFPHEPHQKFQPRHKLAAFERNVDWFRFWLQGHEDEGRSKERQYHQWNMTKAAIESRAEG